MSSAPFPIDPEFDLVLERVVPVRPELVWKAWTQPEHLKKWFTPAPWKTVACTIDLRPGGEFHTTMQSPEGDQFPNAGCYLEVVENKKLVWTSALRPGYRPRIKATNPADLLFTAAILIEAHPQGSKYTAIAMHASPEDRRRHSDMGFTEGWGAALDQLVEWAKKM